MARYYNRRRSPAPSFTPGDMVYLDSADIQTTRPSKKLSHRRLGPYPLLPPAVPPPVNQAPPRRTQCVSRPPGEWWKVKHTAEPEAEPPVIWSDNEEDADQGEHAHLATDPEPRTFKQAMQGSQSDRWREAALRSSTTL